MNNLLADKRENLLNTCVDALQTCVEIVQKHSSDPVHLQKLTEVAKEYSEIELNYAQSQRAMEATRIYFDDENNDTTLDVKEVYNQNLENEVEDTNYTEHPIFRKITKAVSKKTSEVPSKCRERTTEDANTSLRFTQEEFQPPIDPISKKIIRNACKNRLCGHVYDYDSVIAIIKKNARNKCPYVGCTNSQMHSKHIVKDDELQEKINEFLANITDSE